MYRHCYMVYAPMLLSYNIGRALGNTWHACSMDISNKNTNIILKQAENVFLVVQIVYFSCINKIKIQGSQTLH